MSSPPEVTLRPMTDAEYEDWQEHNIHSFAAGIGPLRGLTGQAAVDLARDEVHRLLPNGRSTARHLLWTACVDGEPVGGLWISVALPVPYVFGVLVTEQHRGKGYGRALMVAAEQECRRLGYRHLDLNVFSNNSRAISLYDSLGYTVVSQMMRKEL
ncbi:GCN5-related N-acetyltransferase [Kribbella flavida DSM 17836]|uniref:GCN5-related N-acetyltransferase n=1 Tax=Kribbella flavida (strain DSM 17836 / JCM 10339 / NBRC 14399) TaxID=479435 RepID=D2Q2J1_KRIFD|nr:GNAT family N-acetyltransferase [Kribbella flavida]ADB35887.1 GCN5-related N-acetyltransferase [Kribbella flavida DSM 17836]